MAQRTTVTYVDDLTGDEIGEGKGGPVVFGFNGAEYVIDLSDKSRKELENLLTAYLHAASPHRSAKRPATRKTAPATSDAAQIRVWARANGDEVPDRGRIPKEIRQAYAAAH